MHTGSIVFRIMGMLIIGLVCSLIACGGGSNGPSQGVNPPSTVAVVLNPGTISVTVGATLSFTATVSGATNTVVNWAVDGIQGGNSAVGTISGSGNTASYSAPSTSGIHMVTATLVADASKAASAEVTVVASSTIASVSVSPATSSLDAGTQVQFTATVSGTGSYSQGVTWSAQRGSITSGGLYTAPATAGSDVVTATSVQDGSKTATLSITVAEPTRSATPALVELVVSPSGLAGNPGTLTAPTTLEGARDLLRKASRSQAGTLRVLLRGGIYPRSATLDLTSLDTGSQANPIEYVAYANEVPRLVGGVSLGTSSLKLMDASDVNASRLDSSVRSHVWVADLSAWSGSLGSLDSRMNDKGSVNQAAECFVDGAAMSLARYPDAVDSESVVLARKGMTIRVTGTSSPDVTGDYAYAGDDSRGQPYYRQTKNGVTWIISADNSNGFSSTSWALNNRRDLGGTGTFQQWKNVWGTAGPAGMIQGNGTLLLEPADGSQAMPSFMMIRSTNGSTTMSGSGHVGATWAHPEEAMLYGMYYHSWAAFHMRPAQIQADASAIAFSSAPPYGIQVGQFFYAYNVLEELTAPGEYYVDPRLNRLYLYPPADKAPGEVLISMLQTPILRMRQVKYVTWQGITFEAARDVLVDAQGCESVSFLKCTCRNAGGNGLRLSGNNNLVDGCAFYGLGAGGIRVAGGDRYQLTPSGTVIQNCDIHHIGRLFSMYEPAINIASLTGADDCVGITVQHNEMHHLPHQAIWYSGGNNHTIRWNYIHDVVQWSGDASAIYAGRDWGSRGTVIQGNLFHTVGGPIGVRVSGVYFDDSFAGATVEGNIFVNAGLDTCVQHGGGRDVIIRYNIFYGAWKGVLTYYAGEGNLLTKVQKYNYQSPPWSTAYPELAAIPSDYTQVTGTHWLRPEGSVLYGNLQYGKTALVYWDNDGGAIPWFKQVGQNLAGVDPLFTDPANGDYSLRKDSPMWAIPGFPGIDFTKIGIQK